jgi:hypothetical protein
MPSAGASSTAVVGRSCGRDDRRSGPVRRPIPGCSRVQVPIGQRTCVAAGAHAVQKEGARIRRLWRRELAGASRNGRCRGWKRCSHCGQPSNKWTTRSANGSRVRWDQPHATVQAFAASVAASHSRSPFYDRNCGGRVDVRRGQSTDVSDREFVNFSGSARLLPVPQSIDSIVRRMRENIFCRTHFSSWRDASTPLTFVAQLGIGPTADLGSKTITLCLLASVRKARGRRWRGPVAATSIRSVPHQRTLLRRSPSCIPQSQWARGCTSFRPATVARN